MMSLQAVDPLARRPEPDHGNVLPLLTAPRLESCFVKLPAAAVVARGLLALHLAAPHLLEALGGAVAAIGLPGGKQGVGGLAVEVEALGLEVGGVRPFHVGAFVPVQSQPSQGFQDVVQRPLDQAALVGVLDADDEAGLVALPPLALYEEPVEDGGADVADVGVSGGAGGVADADRHGASLVGTYSSTNEGNG